MTRELTEYRLGDICRLVKGSYSSTKTSPGDYPLVVTAAQRRTALTHDLHGPAVCIPLISSTGHGDAAIHRLHFQDGPFALANLLVALLPHQEGPANAEYLYWYLTAKKDEVLVPLMRGTANVSLKEKDVANVVVSLPPLPEQQRIVARIKSMLEKVEEAQTLHRQRTPLLDIWHQQKLRELFRTVFSIDTSKALGEIADIRAGVTLGKVVNGGISIPYLRVANVQDGYLDLSKIKNIEIHEQDLSKWRLQKGDLLITEGGDWDKLGRGTIWNDEIEVCIHQNHVFRARITDDSYSPSFVSACLSSPQGKEYFQNSAKQTTNLASINQKQLKAFTIPEADTVRQKSLLSELETLKSKIAAIRSHFENSKRELDALPASILARAFAGEL
ncbi:restriction endonuclease subunit S [Deinococcus aquaticus]|uniref:restriction endonuclease subunit S n=1 Tax=Deinococcus aquaticus TaxID=328692 RepID=UPI003F4575BC